MLFKAFSAAIGNRLFLTALLCLQAAAFSSCRAQGNIKFEKRDLILEGQGKTALIKAEIARTGAERARGLMYRQELKDGEGMLFIFERDETLSFWMKNTTIPLSIAYISSEGRILEIHDLEAGNLNPVRSGRSARYALEVPRGYFARTGFGPGDRVAVDKL
ncbi:MAG: DUF192 domain-containing protein [Treponema sp.]|jgi:uncharacterized membrane protein (UPF0127 family)|nr:DUF192 domain-containing protein [Treponema sp.]